MSGTKIRGTRVSEFMVKYVTRDDWLTSVIGKPSFRILGSVDAEFPTIMNEFDSEVAQGLRFAYVKIPMDCVGRIAAFSGAGFYAVDTSVTFQRKAVEQRSRCSYEAVEIRPGKAADLEAAREIAGNCIMYSRFHLDPQFGKVIGDAVNRAWMQSYCDGIRGEEVLVAAIKGQVVGFNAILRSSHDGRPCRVIDLIGVDGRVRGRGIGQALLERFIADSVSQGLEMRVTTQAANIPAVRLYESSGFRLAEASLVMHGHFS